MKGSRLFCTHAAKSVLTSIVATIYLKYPVFKNIYETRKETGNWQINRKKGSNSISRGQIVNIEDKAAVVNSF